MKFLDDMTIAEAIYIKEKVVPHPNPNPVQHVPYHARTGHFLIPEASHIHSQIANLTEYSAVNKMKIKRSINFTLSFMNSRDISISESKIISESTTKLMIHPTS